MAGWWRVPRHEHTRRWRQQLAAGPHVLGMIVRLSPPHRWPSLPHPPCAVAMEPGLRFAIREGGRTVGAGVVAEIVE